MPWEIQHGIPRFYEREQVFGKLYKIYRGSGEQARQAEIEILLKKAAINQEKQFELELTSHLDQYEAILRANIDQSLIAMGYHKRPNNRHWSYPRGQAPSKNIPEEAKAQWPLLKSLDEEVQQILFQTFADEPDAHERALAEINQLRDGLYKTAINDLEKLVSDYVSTTWLSVSSTGYRLCQIDTDDRSKRRLWYWEKRYDHACHRNIQATKLLLRLYKLRRN